jgi:hypothetical protein
VLESFYGGIAMGGSESALISSSEERTHGRLARDLTAIMVRVLFSDHAIDDVASVDSTYVDSVWESNCNTATPRPRFAPPFTCTSIPRPLMFSPAPVRTAAGRCQALTSQPG